MKLLYLIGYPIAHSVSPEMHNAALEYLELEYRYLPKSVFPQDLKATIDYLRNPAVRGFNVTIPYKITVMDMLDAVDPTAREIGAVNTVVNEGGKLTGFNSDGVGALKALTEKRRRLEGCRVLIIGAGGAARAVAYNLAGVVDELTILNRDPAKSALLADYLSILKGKLVESGSFDSLIYEVPRADILINATPVGMVPATISTPVDAALLHSGLLVFDLIYNPLRTRLLREAEAVGAETLDGLRMLVHQGAEAFRLWTGVEPPRNLMARVAADSLGGRGA